MNDIEKKDYERLLKRESNFFKPLSFLVFLLSGLFFILITYSFYLKLDVIAEAYGSVVPSSKVKSVQHLEGGIIKKILIEPGALVKEGQELLILEPTESLANVSELDQRLINLKVDIIRLEAEANNIKPTYTKDIISKYPVLVSNSQKLYVDRLASYNASLKEYKTLMDNDYITLALLNEQIDISKSLLEEKLTNRLTHLNILKERSQLVTKIGNTRSSIKKLQDSSKAQSRSMFQEKVAEYDELTERMVMYRDNLKRTTLRAPVDGIIKQRYIDTIGGVVKPGETLLDIVPINDKLIIQARLSVDQIGYIKKGQKAIVRLIGNASSLYDSIDGIVITISPDVIAPSKSTEEPYYEVKIETDKDYFYNKSEKYYMFPGTQVMAGIKIGTRTIADYIIEPMFGKISNAMSEK